MTTLQLIEHNLTSVSSSNSVIDRLEISVAEELLDNGQTQTHCCGVKVTRQRCFIRPLSLVKHPSLSASTFPGCNPANWATVPSSQASKDPQLPACAFSILQYFRCRYSYS